MEPLPDFFRNVSAWFVATQTRILMRKEAIFVDILPFNRIFWKYLWVWGCQLYCLLDMELCLQQTNSVGPARAWQTGLTFRVHVLGNYVVSWCEKDSDKVVDEEKKVRGTEQLGDEKRKEKECEIEGEGLWDERENQASQTLHVLDKPSNSLYLEFILGSIRKRTRLGWGFYHGPLSKPSLFLISVSSYKYLRSYVALMFYLIYIFISNSVTHYATERRGFPSENWHLGRLHSFKIFDFWVWRT